MNKLFICCGFFLFTNAKNFIKPVVITRVGVDRFSLKK